MRKFREDSIPEKTKKLRNMVYKNLKGKYWTLRALFGKELASSTGDTPPRVKFKLCKLFYCSENKHKEFLQIFFLKWIFIKLCLFFLNTWRFILKQDACTGVHSACRREENGHNLDISVLRRLRLRQGQMQGFLGLKVGGGVLNCKYGI